MEKATKHFHIEEIMPPPWGGVPALPALWYFDKRILETADMMRERYGKAYINNWNWGGKNRWGGWRPFDCEIGSMWSQHKFGRALDIKFADVTAEEVRDELRRHGRASRTFRHITTVENKVSWVHIDCRMRGEQKGTYDIHFFNP